MIIKNTVSEFSTTPIVISTKEDGLPISATAKELSGLRILKINLEGSTLEIGKMILNKAAEQCSINKVTDTMECGWTIYLMARVE